MADFDLSEFKEGSKVLLNSDTPFLKNRKGVIETITDEYIEFKVIVNEPLIYANGEAPRYVTHTIYLEKIISIESRTGRF